MTDNLEQSQPIEQDTALSTANDECRSDGND